MDFCSILIVDDSEADRYLLKRSFQKIDIVTDIFESENGQDAIDFLRDYEAKKESLGKKFPPVIIFLDINMPLMNGFDFLKSFSQLRQSQTDYISSILVMFSSSEEQEDKDKAFSYPFVKDYLVKGKAGPKVLREKIEKILSKIS